MSADRFDGFVFSLPELSEDVDLDVLGESRGVEGEAREVRAQSGSPDAAFEINDRRSGRSTHAAVETLP